VAAHYYKINFLSDIILDKVGGIIVAILIQLSLSRDKKLSEVADDFKSI